MNHELGDRNHKNEVESLDFSLLKATLADFKARATHPGDQSALDAMIELIDLLELHRSDPVVPGYFDCIAQQMDENCNVERTKAKENNSKRGIVIDNSVDPPRAIIAIKEPTVSNSSDDFSSFSGPNRPKTID